VLGGKRGRTELTPTEKFLAWVDRAEHRAVDLMSHHAPMIVPPCEWDEHGVGGYLNHPRPVPLILGARQDSREGISEPGAYALNTLSRIQSTPWQVNGDILAVQRYCYEKGLKVDGIPSQGAGDKLHRRADDAAWEVMTPEQKKAWVRTKAIMWREHILGTSERIAFLSSITEAERFSGYRAVWMPWAFDSRSRVYCVVPTLSPQGADRTKSLLRLANGLPLGPTGVDWLAIHLANCWGYDKVDFEERVAWVHQHRDEIEGTVKDILALTRGDSHHILGGHHMWWADADKPMCFLAAAIEWVGYLEQGEQFVSHLPVAMDGSCSGLQHYSALLRDRRGGEGVNLVPQAKPNDIYHRVADMVEQRLEQNLTDSENSRMARALHGRINRSVCKPTTMTIPYGVTMFGAILQLKGIIKEGKLEVPLDDPAERKEAVTWLAREIFAGIDDVVPSARACMDWFKACAKAIIEKTGSAVLEWRTPAGFLVRQQYNTLECLNLQLLGPGKVRIRANFGKQMDAPKMSKHLSSTAPNIIHSFDASHLLTTVSMCHSNGVSDLALIHDSFGTHACNIPRLRRILAHTFRNQYLPDRLDEMRTWWQRRYDIELPPPPPSGTLRVQDIVMSKYLFS
jgi:DNA-directed RNA polymerase, mitochondrial